MKTAARNKVVLIGCGNVAWHMASRLKSKGGRFQVAVFNHRPNKKLNEFKKVLKCDVFESLKHIPADADYYILAVSDEAVKKIAAKLTIKNPAALLMHTSGSLSLKLFRNHVVASGVLYPLQSFSMNDKVSWDEIPLIVESSDPKSIGHFAGFAKNFGPNIHLRSEKQRLSLHLAAVLSNNFTNALFAAADHLLEKAGQAKDFELLLPLIHKTVDKLTVLKPVEAQTGPAKRKDRVVMKKHQALLSSEKTIKDIYKRISRLIAQQQTNHA